MSPRRARPPIDHTQYVGRQAELFAEALGVAYADVRYVELVEHNGQRWTRRFAWQLRAGNEWADVEWRPPTH